METGRNFSFLFFFSSYGFLSCWLYSIQKGVGGEFLSSLLLFACFAIEVAIELSTYWCLP